MFGARDMPRSFCVLHFVCLHLGGDSHVFYNVPLASAFNAAAANVQPTYSTATAAAAPGRYVFVESARAAYFCSLRTAYSRLLLLSIWPPIIENVLIRRCFVRIFEHFRIDKRCCNYPGILKLQPFNCMSRNILTLMECADAV